jgi:hypothetical protein
MQGPGLNSQHQKKKKKRKNLGNGFITVELRKVRQAQRGREGFPEEALG